LVLHGLESGGADLASLLCGAFHLITWTYAIIAAFIESYLGLLWMWTWNLLTPMITNAVYDFAALVFFLRAIGARVERETLFWHLIRARE
jgi:membrane protease YdiL (CAAX protease family)